LLKPLPMQPPFTARINQLVTNQCLENMAIPHKMWVAGMAS
jgi:hypothetical protein